MSRPPTNPERALILLGWEFEAFESFVTHQCTPSDRNEILRLLEPNTNETRVEMLSKAARAFINTLVIPAASDLSFIQHHDPITRTTKPMKFFFHLHDDSKTVTENAARYVYPSQVYGPFEDEVQARKEMSRLHPNNKEARFLLFDAVVCSVPPSPLEKPEAEKRAPGDESNWTRHEPDDDNKSPHYTCNTCKAQIMNAKVAHPIHDGPFPLSGSGQCRYEDVGYCSNCERKPNFHGAPVSG